MGTAEEIVRLKDQIDRLENPPSEKELRDAADKLAADRYRRWAAASRWPFGFGFGERRYGWHVELDAPWDALAIVEDVTHADAVTELERFISEAQACLTGLKAAGQKGEDL